MHLSPLSVLEVGTALGPPHLASLQDLFNRPNLVFGQGFGRRWLVRPGSVSSPALLQVFMRAQGSPEQKLPFSSLHRQPSPTV